MPEIPGPDGEYPDTHPRAKFRRPSVNSRKKSGIKQPTEKPILLSSVKLSPTPCPRLQTKTPLS